MTYTERLTSISDQAERRIADISREHFNRDTLLSEGIDTEFNSGMNGIVGYTIRGIINGRLYCSDEEKPTIEQLLDNYNAVMDYDELTPYGCCLLTDALTEPHTNLAEQYEAIYDEARAYLCNIKGEVTIQPIQLTSEEDMDPWFIEQTYVSFNGNAGESYSADGNIELLCYFLREDLAKLADAVSKAIK